MIVSATTGVFSMQEYRFLLFVAFDNIHKLAAEAWSIFCPGPILLSLAKAIGRVFETMPIDLTWDGSHKTSWTTQK